MIVVQVARKLLYLLMLRKTDSDSSDQDKKFLIRYYDRKKRRRRRKEEEEEKKRFELSQQYSCSFCYFIVEHEERQFSWIDRYMYHRHRSRM